MTIDATTGATAAAQKPAANTANTTSTDNTTASATVAGKTDTPKLSGAAAVAAAHQQLNVAIVQSALTVSLSSKNDPLALVYKSAIANLNEQLSPTLGDNAIQNAASQDNSPEGTAGRIVSLSTGLFDLYKKSFPNEDESTVLDRFMKVIQGGVDEGFKEARSVLSGLGVLDGKVGIGDTATTIGANIDKTYTLVGQGFADFIAATKAKIAASAAATAQANGTAITAPVGADSSVAAS
jgi:hypothetical protein